MRFRVFAALDLPPENQERLGDVVTALQAGAPPRAVRWVRPQAMHLTLKFYGDVEAEALAAVEAAVAEAAGGASRMELHIAGLGVFPNARRPQVIWAGLAGDLEPLRALQRDLEVRSALLGYAPEAREFKPHLTLGRVNAGLRPAEQARLMEHLKAHRDVLVGGFVAETLSLVRSDLRPNGAEYTTLLAAPLGTALRAE